jgi:hypothetical protein
MVYHAEGSADAPVVPLAFSLLPEVWAAASCRQLVGYWCGLGCFFRAYPYGWAPIQLLAWQACGATDIT